MQIININKFGKLLLIAFTVCIYSSTASHSLAYTKTISINNTISFPLVEDLWIGKIIHSKIKDTFWALGFKKGDTSSPYQLYKIGEKGLDMITELPIYTDQIQNSYLHIQQISFFKLINNKLFIGIKKTKNDIHIVIYDTLNLTHPPQTINLTPHTNSELLLDDQGNIYVLGLESNNLMILQKINESGKITSKKVPLNKKEIKGTKISAALLLNNFFYISIIDDPANYNKSVLIKMDSNGSTQKITTIDGIVFSFYSTIDDNIIAIKSGKSPNDDSQAITISNDLIKKQSYTMPTIYGLIQYEGSLAPMNNSMLYIKRESVNIGVGKVNLTQFAYDHEPLTLLQLQSCEKANCVVYNLINTQSDNMLTLGISYEEINNNKSQKIFKIYEIDTSNN